MKDRFTIRSLREGDISSISAYWRESDDDYLVGMGVDLSKMPSHEQFSEMLLKQINTPNSEKTGHCIIWEVNGEAIGHNNINNLIQGKDANMHLHIWHAANRNLGWGETLIRQSIPSFFELFSLNQLNCEPYALNPAPHKLLKNLGFEFEKEYVTTPGSINFEQPVKRWTISRETALGLKKD